MLEHLGRIITKKNLIPLLVAAVIFALPFERIPSLDVSVFGMSITLRLSLFFCSALMIVAVPHIWKRRAELKDPAFILLGVFLFTYLLSVLVSTDLKRAVAVWIFTAFTCFTALAMAFLYGSANKQWVDRVVYITTCIILIFGFYQFVGDLLGLSPQLTGLRDLYVKSVLGFTRIQSTGLEPLYYANYLTIPLLYFAVKFLRGDDEHPYLLALIATQMILTVSRGAIVAASAGLVVVLIIAARKTRYTQVLGLLGLVLVGVALALNISYFTTRSPKASTNTAQNNATAVVQQATNYVPQDDRVRNRELALKAFMEQPFLGIGPGNFSNYSKSQVGLYREWGGYIIANNEPAELLAEGGVVNFLLLVSFFALVWWRVVRHAWKLGSYEEVWTVVISGFLVTMAIQYQTFSTLYVIHLWVLVGIGLALTTPSLQAQGDMAVAKVRSALVAPLATKATRNTAKKKRSRRRKGRTKKS